MFLSLKNEFLFVLGEREYYEKQFATLRSFEEVDSLESPHVIDEEEDRKEQAQHERAMNISNWANIFLLAFKVIYFIPYAALLVFCKLNGKALQHLSYPNLVSENLRKQIFY